MICQPCRKAGDANSSALVLGAFDSEIRQMHDMCTGCDCQHKVGPSEKFHSLTKA